MPAAVPVPPAADADMQPSWDEPLLYRCAGDFALTAPEPPPAEPPPAVLAGWNPTAAELESLRINHLETLRRSVVTQLHAGHLNAAADLMACWHVFNVKGFK